MFDGLEVIPNRKCWVEKKKKRRKGKSNCYCPTSPIRQRRPENNIAFIKINKKQQ